ncbi:ATP-binding protein [Deltaproteobacteria bacterium]|nr:ATP-binding protein [Deltaproteobacteria bacterium]
MKNEKRPDKERSLIVFVSIIAVILMATGIGMGSWSAAEMKEQVVRQFNEEQLVIAHGLSGLIERELGFLKKEILLLRGVISGSNIPGEHYEISRENLSRVLEKGVSSIDIVDLKKRERYIHVLYRDISVKKEQDATVSEIFPEGTMAPETVWTSKPRVTQSGTTMTLATPLAEDSPKILLFNIDLTWFFKNIFKDIRSGKTGYAWLIDEDGLFLFHPESSFIGRDAFEVREERDPDISYDMINFIQKEKMMTGQEGSGYYFSGWHRGITGKIRKLIAFCPAIISENPVRMWSVAVVVPISEIEDAVRNGYHRQFILQLFMIVVILFGAFAIIFFERRWSRSLAKRVEKRTKELSKAQENYRSLVESADDFIFTVDSNGIFQSINSFTANFFGGPPEDFVGKDLSCLFPEDIAQKQFKMIGMVNKFGKSVRHEFDLQMGEYQIWINAKFMPLKDEEGNVRAILCIARDITENKNLERRMINTEKLASMGTLAAGVAHEINNPLSVILGFCDLLVRNTVKESRQYEDLKTIERQGLHCKQVVENLLSFARIGEGESEFSDLNQCLEEIIQVVAHTLEMKGIDLLMDLDEKQILVKGDSRELQQVFMNLINNAISSMEDRGGALTIRTKLESKGERAVIQIQDEGIGIGKEDGDHIFEPFFTTKPEGEGTGLGLFVSYGIIKKYGGSIDFVSHTADSSNRGGGTLFTIKLHRKRRDDAG